MRGKPLLKTPPKLAGCGSSHPFSVLWFGPSLRLLLFCRVSCGVKMFWGTSDRFLWTSKFTMDGSFMAHDSPVQRLRSCLSGALKPEACNSGSPSEQTHFPPSWQVSPSNSLEIFKLTSKTVLTYSTLLAPIRIGTSTFVHSDILQQHNTKNGIFLQIMYYLLCMTKPTV